jgi:hypothetical protein
MKRISSSILAALFLISVNAAAPFEGTAKITRKSGNIAASLDVLASRVDAYWNALLKKKMRQAAEYVTSADRDKFYEKNIPTFSNPYLKSVELSADRKEAWVTVNVTRIMAPLGAEVSWPVKEKWRFEKGSWYRTIPEKSPGLFPGMKKEEKTTSGDAAVSQDKIRKLLIFPNTILDFGTVRESMPLQLSLKYTLRGDKTLGVVIKAPDGGGIEGGSEQLIDPGDHELRITVPTWQLDGPVNEKILLTVRQPGTGIPFEIELKGNVYVPVSISPKMLKFKKDEREKEVRIRNNTKSNLEILPVYSETRQVQIQPLPITILPGNEIVLKVTSDKKSMSLPANQVDALAIPFAKPVDGVNALSLNVVLNADDGGKGDEARDASDEIPYFRSNAPKGCQGRPAIK